MAFAHTKYFAGIIVMPSILIVTLRGLNTGHLVVIFREGEEMLYVSRIICLR